MGISVSVHASSNGKHHEITLEKTGLDKGTIRVRTWSNPQHSGDPDKDELVKLYAIKSLQAATSIACKGDVTGPDPTIVCALTTQAGAPAVAVEINGTFAGMFDGKTFYPVTANDSHKISQFLQSAHFPA
jgi:hypothetical protein